MKVDRDILWVAAPEEHLVVTYHLSTGRSEKKLTYLHEIWDICPHEDGLWMMTGGGRLGRQLVLWSLEKGEELRKFNCPDGAGAGMTLYDGRLWLSHRHNRKLFCLDTQSGKVNWVIRTENETFSPATYGNELWLIESDPGPLGHWSDTRQQRYFFSRYDPARERILERLVVPFIPHCMAFDGERFWYSEREKKGLSSTKKDFGQF
ncbi:MAG: hypothetical protein ACE5JO_08595 [Candidatus Binatia bacterium]